MTDMYNKSKGFTETPEEIEYELRAKVGSVWSGGRLFIGMYTFLLAALAFAYFYLRTANSGLQWRPHNMTAPTSFGWAIFALEALTAVLAIYGQWRLRKGVVLDWQVAVWTGVLTSLVALFLQIWETTTLPFYPGASGYSSTFVGWVVINIATLVVGAYWLETTVARSMRMRKELGTENPELSSVATARLFRANVASMTYFWGFVALSGALFLALFYIL